MALLRAAVQAAREAQDLVNTYYSWVGLRRPVRLKGRYDDSGADPDGSVAACPVRRRK